MPTTLLSPPPNDEPPARDGLRLSSHLYFAAGMALLIGILVSSYMQASAGLDTLKAFGLMNQRADHLDRLSQLLVEAQSSVRGYALTHDEAYLGDYEALLQKVRDALATVKADAKNTQQQDAVGLLAARVGDLAARIDLIARHVKNGTAPDNDWFAQDTHAMDAFRQQLTTMKVWVLTKNLDNVEQSVSSFQNARLSAVVLAGASLLLLILVISQQRKKQDLQERIHHLLALENERLENDVRVRTQELTHLATYLTHVREAEKLALARELHDELGALLTAAKLDADWIERKLPPDARAAVAQRLVRLRQSLVGGITLKRRITNNLRPVLLYDLGLLEALKALVDEFRQGEEKIDVLVTLPESEPELSEDVSLSLFRIVQEAFTNIRKYAQADHVRVSLRVQQDAIELEIEDDGIGFDPDSPRLARHGLAGIKHRVFTHGGRFDIQSAPGKGVTLRVRLPA
ncbi:sensor histidine kinase [Thiobacillus sp.]